MFHSTFPKLDIITDYILNYEAAARTSVTSQRMCGGLFLRGLEGEKNMPELRVGLSSSGSPASLAE